MAYGIAMAFLGLSRILPIGVKGGKYDKGINRR